MGLLHFLAFIAGVLVLQVQRELPPPLWLIMLAIPALLPWRLRAHSALFMLGLLLAYLQAQALLEQRWPASRHDEEVRVEGRIASLPDLGHMPARRNEAEPARVWRFLFEPVTGEVPSRIRVAWYRSPEIIKGGECWSFLLRLKSPHGSLNPGTFDYEAWLFRQGIGATATVREAQRCDGQGAQVLRGGMDAVLRAAEDDGGYAVLKRRQSLVDRLDTWLPEHPALGLVAALTVGDTSKLTAADWDDFRLTGTTHLVAISGFNIAIVAGAAFFLLRWAWSLWPPLCLRLPAQKAGLLGAAVFALGYALLAGFEPPVLRATIMLWILLAAAWLQRLGQPLRVLALAALLILLFDALALMAPGFWLSFGAVAAIFCVSTHRLGAPGWLHMAVVVQLMLSVALIPLTLHFFHGASWATPLINLIVVPLFALLTPLLLLALTAAALWPAGGLPLLQLVAAALQGLREMLGLLAQQWPGMWISSSPPWPALLLALGGALLLFAPRGLPLRRLALLCFLPLHWPPQPAPREGFELTVLDVGQGLSVIVRTAQRTLVFDAGPAFDEGFDAGESVVAPYLLGQGTHAVDRLVISHAHNDHGGGAPALRRLLDVRDELGALTVTPCRDGDSWDWDGVHFQILHPDPHAWSVNNISCVLRVSVGDQAVLLTGDIEKAAEQRLLRDRAADLRAQLLVAPHHGSKTSSTAEFIAAVDAHTVIFSAGWKHHFRHPHPSVVERYELSGATLYGTGWTGAVRVEVTPQGMSAARLWRAEGSRYWNSIWAEMPEEAVTGSPAVGGRQR